MTASNVIPFPACPVVTVEDGGRWPGWAVTVINGKRKRQNPFIAWRPYAEKYADDLAARRGWGRA